MNVGRANVIKDSQPGIPIIPPANCGWLNIRVSDADVTAPGEDASEEAGNEVQQTKRPATNRSQCADAPALAALSAAQTEFASTLICEATLPGGFFTPMASKSMQGGNRVRA
jgi:hypothetical protein